LLKQYGVPLVPERSPGSQPGRQAGADVYFIDRGIEELDERRGDELVSLGWLAHRLQDFADLGPRFAVPVGRLATWLVSEPGEEAG
jgi:hypothetical protein